MKRLLSKIKILIVNIFRTYFYPVNKLPVGTHLYYFLKYNYSNNIYNVFDVGANKGQTVINVKNYFPNSRVFCFEPFINTFNCLKKNTKNLKNVQCYQFALGDKNEIIKVPIVEEGSVANSLNLNDNNFKSTKFEEIEISTLDLFCDNEFKDQTIDLLKIDTEGYDLKVLQGAENLFKSSRVKFILTEVGLTKQDTYHVYLGDMIDYLNSNNFEFIGIFGLDIRHIFWSKHFGNALFICRDHVKSLKNIVIW